MGLGDLDQVERALVASASGALTPETIGLPSAGIRFAPDLLRAQALHWQAHLDPDGTAASPKPRGRTCATAPPNPPGAPLTISEARP